MRYKHTGHITQSPRSMDFNFPTYRICVCFGSHLPIPEGDWLPTSLFMIDDDHSILLLKHSSVGSFWLLNDDFSLIGNDHESLQSRLEFMLISEQRPNCDRALICEIHGLISYFDRKDQAAYDAFVEACDLGEMQDAESYSAMADVSSRLGQLPDTLPIIETALNKPDFFTPEQAAIPKAWLGRSYADHLDFARGHATLVAAIAGFASPPDWLHGVIDWCARQDRSAQFGNPPAALLNEAAEFGRATLDFLAGRHCLWTPGRYPTLTVALHWIRQAVKIIHLEPADTESIALLSEGGISPVFLQAVAQGRDGVGEACFAASPDVPFATDPSISLRVKEVAAAILLGGKPILCPFTGDRDLARDTINMHTFLHRKNGRSCIIFSDPDISIAPADSAWYFPDLGVLLTAGWNMRPEVELAVTLQRVLCNLPKVTSYLATSERPIMVSEESMGHIGHYVWNVISGWKNLFDLVDARDITVLTTYQNKHFFGGVTELYRNEINPIAHVLRIASQEDAYGAMLKHGGLSLILRDQNVTNDVARRVQAWCQKNVSDEFLNTLASFSEAADPLIMVTIRLENRAWVEQESGFISIVNSLAAEYPRLGIIIDGLNAAPPGTTTYAPMSMSDEQAIADRIIKACPSVPFINSIGCTPAESVLWCAAIDAFLAPIGAGLAKSRWISNKPGVGFSNRTFLAEGHFEGYLYSHFREKPSTMLYVAREHVSDVDGGHHGQIGRANFSMGWRAPLAELRKLLNPTNLAPPT